MTRQPSDLPEALLAELCRAAGGVAPADARRWMARGWVDPRVLLEGEQRKTAVVRRLVRIQEIHASLGVGEDALDVVLNLIDKLRLQTEKLACLQAAMDAAPDVDADLLRREAARIFRERMEAE